MSTDRVIEDQLRDYFAWIEEQLGPIEVHRDAAGRQQRRRRVASVAAAAIVAVGLAAIGVVGSRDGDRPASPTPPTVPAAPSVDGWVSIAAPAIPPRLQPVSIGTGDGWFVWGGVRFDPDQPDGLDHEYSGAFYDAGTSSWRTVPEIPLVPERGNGWAATWTGSEIVLVEGLERPKAAAFDPQAGTWRRIDIPDETLARWVRNRAGYSTGTAWWVADRVVVYAAGDPQEGTTGGVMLYDPANDAWTPTIESPLPTNFITRGVTASATELFVVGVSRPTVDGGCDDSATLHRFDVATRDWSSTPLPEPGAYPGVVAWTGDHVLVGGGLTCDPDRTETRNATRNAWLFDPLTGDWEATTDVPIDNASSHGLPALIDGGVAIVTPNGVPLIFWAEQQLWTTAPPIHDDAVDVGLASFGGQLALYGIGTWSPNSQADGATCCLTSDDTLVYRPSPPSADLADSSPAAAPNADGTGSVAEAG